MGTFKICILYILFSGYTRYLLENMYNPYLPYMPATESLALFAHNSAQLEATLQAHAVQHRIYDLQKGNNNCDLATYNTLHLRVHFTQKIISFVFLMFSTLLAFYTFLLDLCMIPVIIFFLFYLLSNSLHDFRHQYHHSFSKNLNISNVL